MRTNLNFFRSQLIVKTLKQLGLEHVCLSPGSRNTPITFAFAKEPGLNKHVIVDERASAFFALGLAKSTGKPVAIVCTSGTAVAELYPAIIEAYNSRIPLIALTADRPPYLKNSGSNQTINQKQIFAANCDHYYDFGLPVNSESDFFDTINATQSIWENCRRPFSGPVQLNLPFEKPLEPASVDCEIDDLTISLLDEKIKDSIGSPFPRDFSKNVNLLIAPETNIMVVLGNGNYSEEFLDKCAELSDKLKIPVCLESPSALPEKKDYPFIRNFGNLLQSEKFHDLMDIDRIVIFGRNFTSKNVERFFGKWEKGLINISIKGEGFGKPAPNKRTVQINDLDAINSLINSDRFTGNRRSAFHDFIMKADKEFTRLLTSRFETPGIESEIELIATLPTLLKDHLETPVFFSNSLPVRDFDYLRALFKNPVYISRGASGIDGIIATAAGIATGAAKPSVLVTGDLAFHYDSNSLQFLKACNIPLFIILVNNGGGSIFEYLPVNDGSDEFQQYFKTETGVDFGKVASAYGIKHYAISAVVQLEEALKRFFLTPAPAVAQLKFDSIESKERKETIKTGIISAMTSF